MKFLTIYSSIGITFLSMGFSSCTLFVKTVSLCGDGVETPGEICFRETVLTSDQAPFSIITADFNGDGTIDIANSNLGPANNNLPDTITVFLNDGFSFSEATSFTACDVPIEITSADFNADGVIDIAAVCTGQIAQETFVSPSQAAVLFGLGDGSFDQPILFDLVLPAPFFGGRTISAIDIDFDGLPELLVGNLQTNNVALLPNNPNAPGNFLQPQVINTGASVGGLALGDIDLDSDVDFVMIDPALDFLKIFFNEGGTFIEIAAISLNGAPSFITLADFDNDQFLDVGLSIASSNSVFLLSAQNGTFSEIKTGEAPIGVDFVDLDNDGDIELINSDSIANTIHIFSNDGAADFTAFTPFETGESPQLITHNDFNNDGRQDLVITTPGANANLSSISVLLSDF